MPAVSFRHDHNQIIIPIAILPPELDPEPFRAIRINGLIDTGASVSGIRGSVAQELRLPRRGKEIITTPGGEYAARLYQFRLGFYVDPSAAMPHVLSREFIGIECSPGRSFDALIGMDVLGSGDLTIFRDGHGAFVFD